MNPRLDRYGEPIEDDEERDDEQQPDQPCGCTDGWLPSADDAPRPCPTHRPAAYRNRQRLRRRLHGGGGA